MATKFYADDEYDRPCKVRTPKHGDLNGLATEVDENGYCWVHISRWDMPPALITEVERNQRDFAFVHLCVPENELIFSSAETQTDASTVDDEDMTW